MKQEIILFIVMEKSVCSLIGKHSTIEIKFTIISFIVKSGEYYYCTKKILIQHQKNKTETKSFSGTFGSSVKFVSPNGGIL